MTPLQTIHEATLKLCDSVLGNYFLGKAPEEALALTIKIAIKKELIASLESEKPSEWISVEERLPGPLDEDIIALDTCEDKHIALYVSGIWKEWRPNMFATIDWVKVTYPITHWIPLPPPPEAKETP